MNRVVSGLVAVGVGLRLVSSGCQSGSSDVKLPKRATQAEINQNAANALALVGPPQRVCGPARLRERRARHNLLFDALRERSVINGRARAAGGSPAFSARIREGLPG